MPARGFYDWRQDTKPKQPYCIRRRDGEPMPFAGLSERWQPMEAGGPVRSCAIVVTDANELVRALHDRMPVIVARNDFETWLRGARSEAGGLLRPWLEPFPVSTRVNRPASDDPGLIERLTSG